jgi:EF hand domain-containing protein
MNKLFFTIALGATIVSTQAAAQDRRGGRGGWDQQVTRQQAQQLADTMFQRFDLNHDGVVTVKEAEKATASMGFGGDRAGRMLDRVFGDAQSMTLQQFEAQSLARFDREDLNHDGVVTPDERMQARAEMRAQRAGGGQ